MYLFKFLLLAITILSIWCYIVSRVIRRKRRDENFRKKIVVPSGGDCVITVLFNWIWLSVGIYFAQYMDHVFFTILWGSFSILAFIALFAWPSQVILYGENGFSIGWFVRWRKDYKYDDVTQIFSQGKLFVILIGKRRLRSEEYKSELLEFKDYIIQQRKIHDTYCREAENNNCFKSKTTDIFTIITTVIIMLAGLIPQVMSIWCIGAEIYYAILYGTSFFWGILVLLPLLAIGVCITAFGWSFAAIYYRRCEISDQGMIVKYPLEAQKLILWEQFQQVCICYQMGYGRQDISREKRTIICFVKNGESRNGYGHWKTDNPFHYRNVIYMDYSEELLVELKEKYPEAIMDLRGSRLFNDGIKKKLK